MSLTYLALGDSYTIGEAVAQNESFPFQLASKLKLKGLNMGKPMVIAKTGWTTDELQEAIKAANITQQFDMVTLLIGVNNQYRGYSTATYRDEFRSLLAQAVGFAGGRAERVFVLSVPDWGVTSFGLESGRDHKSIAEEIDAFNTINREESECCHVAYTDITPESREAADDLTLLANDGLHYSGKMHAIWASKVLTDDMLKQLTFR